MDLRTRYARREPLTQALPYAATLQDRGWACLFVGASFLILRAKDGGVFARMQRPRAIDLAILAQIQERTGITRLLVEPALAGELVGAEGERTPWNGSVEPFTALGWKRGGPGIAHSKTIVIDLARPFADVVAGFTSVARRNTRKALDRSAIRYDAVPFADATPRDIDQIRTLYDAFLKHRPNLSDEWSFRSRMTAHFGTHGLYITARNKDALVGVVYLPLHDRVAHYYAAFSHPDALSDRVPTGLVAEAIAQAQAHGCDLFDFVGVQDERFPLRNQKWAGFTDFKARFGGEAIALPEALEVIG